MLRLRWLLFILTVLTAACGKFESAGIEPFDIGSVPLATKPLGTCDRKDVVTINMCVEVIGSDYSDQGYLDIFQSSCESTGGLFSTDLCDRVNNFGICVIYPNQTNETRVLYYPPLYTAATAQSACEATPGGFYISN